MNMSELKKKTLLERLLAQADGIKVRSSRDPYFKTWKNTVERTLFRIYGPESPEVKQFQSLHFFYHAMVMTLGKDYSPEDRRCFDRDLEILLASVRNYIEELDVEAEDEVAQEPDGLLRRVIVSHASKDSCYVQELVELLEIIGVAPEAIFCTSLPGYGIDLGKDFLAGIRDELKSDTLVLFVLTHNFYASPVSLCEMGAVWVQTKAHIPILVPPFDFGDVRGVIPLSEGFKINDPLKWSVCKARLQSILRLNSEISDSNWERKRDRVIERINQYISNSAAQQSGA